MRRSAASETDINIQTLDLGFKGPYQCREHHGEVLYPSRHRGHPFQPPGTLLRGVPSDPEVVERRYHTRMRVVPRS